MAASFFVERSNHAEEEALDLIVAAGRGDVGQVWKYLRFESGVKNRSFDGTLESVHLGEKDRREVKRLLEGKSEVEGFTALHVAASTGYDRVVKLLLVAVRCVAASDSEAELLLNARDCIDQTPLHHAAWMQRKDVMKSLLSCREIDVNAQDKDGFRPVHMLLIRWNGEKEILRPLLTRTDVQLDADAKRSEPIKSLLSSKQQQQLQKGDDFWGTDFQLPKLGEWMLTEYPDSVTPLQLIVPSGLEDRGEDPLILLDTVWKLENELLETALVDEICKQLRRVVKGRSAEEVPENSSVMHLAAFVGLPLVMRILATRQKYRLTMNDENSAKQTPLHVAALTGKLDCVKFLNTQESLCGAMEDGMGQTAIEIAFEVGWVDIVRILSQRQDVKDYISMQHADRSVYVDGTNAILVGAALIASITFAGWLQPPLGYQAYYQYTRRGVPQGQVDYKQFAAITEYTSLKVFWIANSLSFYFAIAAILAGAAAVVPRRDLFVRAEVKRLTGALYVTSFALSWAVVFVVVAFTAAGFASLPPITKYYWIMILTLVVGLVVCNVTFSHARLSDPGFFIKFSTYLDPGYYCSTPIFHVLRYVWPWPVDYNSARERVRKRLLRYHPTTIPTFSVRSQPQPHYP